MSVGLNLRCGNLDTLMLQARQARQGSRRQTDCNYKDAIKP